MQTPHAATRLFLEDSLTDGLTVPLAPQKAHYLRQVLRLDVGAPVSVFNGRDGEWLGRLEITGRRDSALTLEKQLRPQTPSPDVWLCPALIRRDPFEILLQKAVEMGVGVFAPVITRRTQGAHMNPVRLKMIAIEAAEQCERLELPEIRPALPLSKLLETWPENRRLFVCAERSEAKPALAAFSEYKGQPAALLTGPEGGFTQDEMEQLVALPFVTPISLGTRILRAETASMAALAVWSAVEQG